MACSWAVRGIVHKITDEHSELAGITELAGSSRRLKARFSNLFEDLRVIAIHRSGE
jgi:hypothetical protein